METACFDTGEYYEKSFGVFLEKSDEAARNKEMLELHLPDAVRHILKGKPNQWSDTFNILSVGCGGGEKDQNIVEIIHKELERNEKFQNTKIFNCALDPNGNAISRYRQDIKSSLVGEQVNFDVHQISWEEYVQERMLNKDFQNRTRFDIVHFMHSLYHLDIQETLDHCFENELKENGLVVCLISDYFTNNIISRLGSILKQYGKAAAGDCYEEKIKSLARERGWNVDHYTLDHFLDFTECFDESSVKGNLLLDFLAQTKNFRATTDKEKVEEVLQVMRDKSTLQDGKVLSTKVEDLLFIYK